MDTKLAILAHDLRTPLTAVKMAVGLLEARHGMAHRPSDEDLLACLKRNVDRLERIAAELTALAEGQS